MKPLYAKFRTKGHICTGFIDDSLLGGHSYKSCLECVNDTIALMTSLGFMLNEENSILIPTHVICY